MKKISILICTYLWTILFCLSISAQDFRSIRDGVEYAEMTRGTKEAPVHINLLRLDLTKVRLDIVHAMDAAIGLEKTSSIATRYGALAAINAGFFRLDRSIFAGDPTSVLMIDKKLLSESYSNRVAMVIANDANKTEVNFAHLELFYLVGVGNSSLGITNGVNRERKKDELIIYFPDFHRTTLTPPGGTEVIVRKGKITAILKSGSNFIPSDGFILSATGEPEKALLKLSKIGAKASFSIGSPFSMLDSETEQLEEEERQRPLAKISDDFFKRAEDIVGGVPQLIKNGKIEVTWQQEKSSKDFVEKRHPRTAVAKLKDGKFLMVTVDGRQEGYSVGMNLNELAAFLLEMGATDAMNLDGGGSTTMFMGGKVVNKPSDKEGERSVSDAILVFPRTESRPKK